MVVSLNVPDSIVAAFCVVPGRDVSRYALEALAVDGYRNEILTQKQVGEMLGLSRMAAEDFLAKHVDLIGYTPEEAIGEAQLLKAYAARTGKA